MTNSISTAFKKGKNLGEVEKEVGHCLFTIIPLNPPT